jgi:two-component sensor histidine kinase
MMLPLNDVTVLGMVVAELVTNSYRHAFPKQGGKIDVTLTHAAEGRGAVLTIADDGIGFTAKAETSRRGMGLVRKLLEQMNGVMTVGAPPGTIWTLNFPVEDMAATEPVT